MGTVDLKRLIDAGISQRHTLGVLRNTFRFKTADLATQGRERTYAHRPRARSNSSDCTVSFLSPQNNRPSHMFMLCFIWRRETGRNQSRPLTQGYLRICCTISSIKRLSNYAELSWTIAEFFYFDRPAQKTSLITSFTVTLSSASREAWSQKALRERTGYHAKIKGCRPAIGPLDFFNAALKSRRQ